MLLCAEDGADISLACQARALGETYRTGGPDGLARGLERAVKQPRPLEHESGRGACRSESLRGGEGRVTPPVCRANYGDLESDGRLMKELRSVVRC